MSFLEYQDDMYVSTVNDDACLVIMSRGIGLEQLMVRLCRTYSDDTSLVIVIGTDVEDELFLTNQIIDEKNVPYGKLPQRVTAESSNLKKRKEIYLNGGVLFVTERILVVDLLSDRVPIDLVTGIIVYKAHRIYNDCLMSFILRLFRMKNKKGFVKALSQNPQSFFGDYGKLDKIMRSLFVTSLNLWPRFHASVQSSLAKPKAQPEVIEINLPMSQTMKNIQFDIMDLIEMCLKELAKTNTAFLYDSDQLNVENAINRSFDGFIKRKFDEIWHQLGPRAKRLINDIQWLRNLLHLLTQSDVVAFYNQTRAAQNSVRVGSEPSDWIFWKPADRLFKLSKERLYPNNSEIADFDAETNLKWKAFQDLIDEIDRETSDVHDTVHVFVVVANDSVARLLNAILRQGAVNVLRERVERFNAIMRANSGAADAIRLLGIKHLEEESKDGENQPEGSHGPEAPYVKKRFRKKNPAAETRQVENTYTLTQVIRKMRKDDGQVVTIDDDDDEVTIDEPPTVTSEEELRPPKQHSLKLHYFSSRDKNIILESRLVEYKPMHVIMYDLDMHAIRQVEVYQALHCHPKRCKVYTIQFENSFDMQQYLTSLRREKEAFENLIKEKAVMVIPSGRDGKTSGHPDLIRGDLKANETTESTTNTRRAGGQVDRNDIIQQKILVDMREFRCELPAIIHKRGIEIEPIQLEIGDYILSSDTSVERKTVSDLIQSLQSGRLYNQAGMMIRHFKRSILLIEFDENKSFHFKGRYWGVQGKTSGYGPRKDYSQDLVERLILLTIHHPNLRIVWSPSVHFTAELFEYLKIDRDQPDAEKIASISSQELPPETFEDKYDIQVRDFLLKLPGVNSSNVYALMNKVPTLADLADVSLEEFQEILSNSRSAKLLYQTLHCSLRTMASEAIRAEMEGKKSRLFSCTKKRKGIS